MPYSVKSLLIIYRKCFEMVCENNYHSVLVQLPRQKTSVKSKIASNYDAKQLTYNLNLNDRKSYKLASEISI